jgi:glycosyltransferase involved in cell wall biosynthesis
MKFSVVLATHNEEANIEACLSAVRDIADEMIVVDGESTDSTVALAKKMGAKVIQTTNKPMFHTNKQMAMDAAMGDWILQLDADEVADDELIRFIKKISKEESEFSAFWIKRKNYFLGTFLKKGGQYPDPVIRLYKKGKAYLPQKDVHEQMEVDGKIGWAEGHLLHYNAPDFSRYITNANRYTTQTAKKLKEQGVALNLWNDFVYLIWKPKITFLKLFFRHKGFVDGFPGLVFALFSGLHHAIAYMKLGDLYREERRIKN